MGNKAADTEELPEISIEELEKQITAFLDKKGHREEMIAATMDHFRRLWNEPLTQQKLLKMSESEREEYSNFIVEAARSIVLSKLIGGVQAVYNFADYLPYLETLTDKQRIAELIEKGTPESLKELETLLQKAYRIRKEAATASRKKPLPSLTVVLDKVSRSMFLPEKSEHGKEYPVKLDADKDPREITGFYSVRYETLNPTFSKELTQYDRRIFDVIASYYYKGYSSFSATQMHYTMGNESRPNSTQLKKIVSSVSKLRTTELYINNEEERKNGYDYPLVKISDTIVSIATIELPGGNYQFILRGEPFLAAFARQRKQLTEINARALLVDKNLTDELIAIQNYLIIRITTHKNKSTRSKAKTAAPCTVLLSTLYEKTGINTRKQQERARDKIEKVLESLKSSGEISAFKFATGKKKDPIKKKEPKADRVIIFF